MRYFGLGGCWNLVAVVEQPFTVDLPIVNPVSIFANADDRSFSVISISTVFAVCDGYAASVSEHDDMAAAVFQIDDFVDFYLFFKGVHYGHKRADIGIDAIYGLFKFCHTAIKFIHLTFNFGVIVAATHSCKQQSRNCRCEDKFGLHN